ncbi:hypothetical protein HDU86_003874 [Geranomyces michiganensis]|nr:hypothetical protein HDU86_003874 [Geranomyces michiganensis]
MCKQEEDQRQQQAQERAARAAERSTVKPAAITTSSKFLGLKNLVAGWTWKMFKHDHDDGKDDHDNMKDVDGAKIVHGRGAVTASTRTATAASWQTDQQYVVLDNNHCHYYHQPTAVDMEDSPTVATTKEKTRAMTTATTMETKEMIQEEDDVWYLDGLVDLSGSRSSGEE